MTLENNAPRKIKPIVSRKILSIRIVVLFYRCNKVYGKKETFALRDMAKEKWA